MSQAPTEGVNVIEAGVDPETGDYPYPPQSAENKVTQGESNFIDGSGLIFSMYMEMATEEDKKMAEGWKAGADGILIFTGLFSAAVATLISVSIQDIRQDPQDTSNFYLSNIFRSMADPNISNTLPPSPPPFSPPNYAIWVNSLWFLSFVISITCALLATLLQQWARRYLKVTQPRYSPHKRARIRAFFAEGVDKFLLPWAVEALPTMLHVALFLFFVGLAVFLWNVNLTIFKVVLSWIGICTALYGCITLVPIFRPDSPFHTPLSFPMWHIVNGIRLVTFQLLYWLAKSPCFTSTAYYRFQDLMNSYRKILIQGMQKTAEETAFKSPPEIDTRAFLCTFDSLDEDHELERFFSGLPGFRTSKIVKDPLHDLTREQQGKLLDALIGLSDHAFSSDLFPEAVKRRRIAICSKGIDLLRAPGALWQVFLRIISEDQYGPVQSANIARLVRGWDNGEDEATTTYMQALVSSVVARAQRRDDLWFSMASDELGVPESVLRDHAMHGDSLSLAILIHIIRRQFTLFRERYWPDPEFSNVLEAASKFNALDTSPELQHEFCPLWNQIVRTVQLNNDQWMAWRTLRPIRNVYIALHRGTNSSPARFSASTGDRDDVLWETSSYPLCNIPSHHAESTHVHDVSASMAIPHGILHDHSTLALPSPATAPDATSPSVSAVVHMDVPLFDNNISVPASFRRTRQAVMQVHGVPSTSLDPATATGATGDIEASARTIPLSTPGTSTSTSFVPLTGAVFIQNNADLARSRAPDVPSSADLKLEPGLDNILPTASISPWPISAPELGVVTGDKGTGLHEDKDTLDPASVDRAIQADTMAILDLPPESPPPPTTDIAIADPSRRRREPDPGNTGDHPPYTSQGQYDIA